jgi:hypothetical protein
VCQGTNTYGADLCVFDSASTGIFANNIIQDTIFTAGTAPISVFGSSVADSSLIISGNVITRITGYFRDPGGAGLISIDSVAGKLLISGNTISDCAGNDNFTHRMICIRNIKSTAVVTIDGNTLIGSDADYMRTAIFVNTNESGARIFVGANTLIDWINEYDAVDGYITFTGATYVSDIMIDNTDSPYDVPANASRILVDSTVASVTVNLPAVALMESRDIQVVDWGGSAGTNPITVAAQAGETINGVASVDITTDSTQAYCHCKGGVYKTLSPVM